MRFEPDEDDIAWALAVRRLWIEDWSDPREDIYTLADGQPIDPLAGGQVAEGTSP